MYEPQYSFETGGQRNIRYVLQAAGLVFSRDRLAIGAVGYVVSALIASGLFALGANIGGAAAVIIFGVLACIVVVLAGQFTSALIARSTKMEIEEGRKQNLNEGMAFLKRNFGTLALYALAVVGLLLLALVVVALLVSIGLIPRVGPALYGLLSFPISVLVSIGLVLSMIFLSLSLFIFPAQVVTKQTPLLETLRQLAFLVRYRLFFLFGCQLFSFIVAAVLSVVVALVCYGGYLLALSASLWLMKLEFVKVLLGMGPDWLNLLREIAPRDLTRVPRSLFRSGVPGEYEIGGLFFGIWSVLLCFLCSSFHLTYMSIAGALTYFAVIQRPTQAAGAISPTASSTASATATGANFGKVIDVCGIWNGQQIEVPARGIRIGKSQGCDIVVDEGHELARFISREHLWIGPDQRGLVMVKDLQSTNGTFLRGERVEQAYLKPGDEVQIGRNPNVRFAYQL